MTKKCLQCGKEHDNTKFCSCSCYDDWRRDRSLVSGQKVKDKACLYCKNIIPQASWKGAQRYEKLKFCSNKCHGHYTHKTYVKRNSIKCLCCRKLFYKNYAKSGSQKFCSLKCYQVWKFNNHQEKKCLYCNEVIEFIPKSHHKKKKFCSRICFHAWRRGKSWEEIFWNSDLSILRSKASEKIRNQIKSGSLIKRPSGFEKWFITLINKFNLPYNYVGNGKLWLDNINPDFVSTDGTNKIIEVYSIYWKEIHFGSEENYKRMRRRIAHKYGYSILFLNENDIYDELLCLKKVGVSV